MSALESKLASIGNPRDQQYVRGLSREALVHALLVKLANATPQTIIADARACQVTAIAILELEGTPISPEGDDYTIETEVVVE